MLNFNRRMSRRQPWHPKYRVMRDEAGHAGGGGSFTPPLPAPAPTPTLSGNNAGGNSGGGSGDSSGDNNAGPKFDPSAFWSSPSEGGSGTPSRESAGTPTPSGGQQEQQQQQPTNQNIGQEIVAGIGKLDFGGGVMTDQAIADLAEGKTESFHQGLNAYGQQIVGQATRIAATLMGHLREDMQRQFDAKMNGTLSQRDNDADLIKEIPSASNPAIKRMVDPIFARAMEVTKGDRKAAIGMTKDMIRFQSEQMGADIGLPPRSAGDNDALVPSNTNWLEELGGRR